MQKVTQHLTYSSWLEVPTCTQVGAFRVDQLVSYNPQPFTANHFDGLNISYNTPPTPTVLGFCQKLSSLINWQDMTSQSLLLLKGPIGAKSIPSWASVECKIQLVAITLYHYNHTYTIHYINTYAISDHKYTLYYRYIHKGAQLSRNITISPYTTAMHALYSQLTNRLT